MAVNRRQAGYRKQMIDKRKKTTTNPHLFALIIYIDLNFLLEKISEN
jgi:hypothetical protein